MAKVEGKEEVEVGEQIKSKKDKIINKMMKTIIQNKLKKKIMKKKKVLSKRKRLKLMRSN